MMSPLSYGILSDGTLGTLTQAVERFRLSEGADTELVPLSELIMSAEVTQDDVDDALQDWRDNFGTALYRGIIKPEDED